MNFSTKTCCRLCGKAHKRDDINVLNDSELGKSIKIIYGIEMETSNLSTFVCCDCRVSAIAFSANYDRVQYIQGQLTKYASMSSVSTSTEKRTLEQRPLPPLEPVPLKSKHPIKSVQKKPYNMNNSTMKFKLGDKVKFVSSGELVHGIIDGLFSKQKKYQIKTPEGEIFKIFHLLVLNDNGNEA